MSRWVRLKKKVTDVGVKVRAEEMEMKVAR